LPELARSSFPQVRCQVFLTGGTFCMFTLPIGPTAISFNQAEIFASTMLLAHFIGHGGLRAA